MGAVVIGGAANVIYGTGSGLSATAVPDQLWTQDSPDVDDVAETGDQFGWALAAANFGAGSWADLAIGVEGENVGGAANAAGAVNVIYGSGSGLSPTASRPDQFWTQDAPDVNDSAEGGDQFGWSLTTANFDGASRFDLAIGVPGERAGELISTGAVNVLYGSGNGLSATATTPDQFFTQNSPNVNDTAEPGDRFGSSLTALR